MKQPKRYAGIIIKNGDEVLMCQRNYDGDMPGQWSVPCGHLHDNENAMVGAKREFFEETGYDKSTYEFIKNYPIIQEEFIGTNNVKYRHTYYLVKMKGISKNMGSELILCYLILYLTHLSLLHLMKIVF